MYVLNLDVYSGRSSITHKMQPQLDAVREAIQADPKLQQGFNFYGASQGALLARAYVTLYNDPPVYNLIGLNGPQNGVGKCPYIEKRIGGLCAKLGTTLDVYAWPACSFCDYWRDPKSESDYLSHSRWLAEVNQEKDETRDAEAATRMASLNTYMMTVALQDEVVQPKESAWHSYWPWNDKKRDTLVPTNETESYMKDWLGLKTLDERGALIFNSFDGPHCGYSKEWFRDNVLPLLDNTLSD